MSILNGSRPYFLMLALASAVEDLSVGIGRVLRTYDKTASQQARKPSLMA